MTGAPKGMPIPAVNRTTEPFWVACGQHRLVIQRCASCGVHRHAPAPLCASCQSAECAWDESKGSGEVYSYMIATHPVHASLKEQVPYAVVVVKLDDCGGVCLTTNLSDVPPEQIRVGMRVKLSWRDVGNGMALPQFARA
jgi:uncharacterized OB-fold protein